MSKKHTMSCVRGCLAACASLLLGLGAGQAWAAEKDAKSTDKPAVKSPGDAKPADAKSAADSASGAKPAESKPTETKPAETKPKKPKDPSKEPGLQGYYAIVAKAVELTPEQKAKLLEILKARAGGVDHEAQLAAATQAAADAKKAGDEDKIKAAKAKVEELARAKDEAEASVKLKLRELLTPEQLPKFEALHLFMGASARYNKNIEITEEQKGKIREICASFGPKAVLAKGEDKALDLVRAEVREKIEAEVLTPEQKEKLAAKKPKK